MAMAPTEMGAESFIWSGGRTGWGWGRSRVTFWPSSVWDAHNLPNGEAGWDIKVQNSKEGLGYRGLTKGIQSNSSLNEGGKGAQCQSWGSTWNIHICVEKNNTREWNWQWGVEEKCWEIGEVKSSSKFIGKKELLAAWGFNFKLLSLSLKRVMFLIYRNSNYNGSWIPQYQCQRQWIQYQLWWERLRLPRPGWILGTWQGVLLSCLSVPIWATTKYFQLHFLLSCHWLVSFFTLNLLHCLLTVRV